MKSPIIEWFEYSGMLAVGLSLFLNILISILGVIPSVFITAANVTFFGFMKGLYISFAGEALGAMISFFIYRKGFKRLTRSSKIKDYKVLKKLQNKKGVEAFGLIVALRIIPFIPSGLVTLASAGSSVGWLNFSIASTLGKIPALLLEAYSVQEILNWFQGNRALFLGICAIVMVMLFIIKRVKTP